MLTSHPDRDRATARERLIEHINACWTTQAIGVSIVLGLPERLADRPSTAAELAERCGCHVESLRRLLRALAALGLVEEAPASCFGLTADGQMLRPDAPDSVHGWAQARLGHWESWGTLVDAVRTGTGFRERRGAGADFGHLGTDPDRARVFHRAMTELTRRIAPAVVEALMLPAGRRVLDVGGGSGELLAALACSDPTLRGDVLDLPHGRAGAQQRFAAGGLGGRCGFVEGDFFESVPAGYDVYLLKSVLHDWDDDRALAVLKRCAAALTDGGARIAVVDRVAPELVTPSARNRELVASDLNMLVHLSGRERTRAEFGSLFGAAGLREARRTALSGAYDLVELRPESMP